MLFEILSVEDKKADWKIVSVREAVESGLTYTDVSMNKTNRDGSKLEWPNWDQLVVGARIEADYWKSQASQKQFLFAPKAKPAKAAGGAFKTQQITQAQEKKAEDIHKAQENRSHGVKVAAAMRDATLITLASLNNEPFPTDEEYQREFEKWRDWYLATWSATEQKADVPF